MEEHRMMLVVDVEDYSSRNGDDQARLQFALVRSLDHAAGAAGLGTLDWERQKQGDGQFVLLPARTDPITVLGRFVAALSECLIALQTATFRMRLRLSVHEGPVRVDGANGYPGDHAVQVARLVGARALRDALAARPEACLGVIISDRIFADYIGQRAGGPPRDQFRRVDVKEKKNAYVAYIHLPGHNVHALDLAPSAPAVVTPGEAAHSGVAYTINGTGINVATYGDQTNHQSFGR